MILLTALLACSTQPTLDPSTLPEAYRDVPIPRVHAELLETHERGIELLYTGADKEAWLGRYQRAMESDGWTTVRSGAMGPALHGKWVTDEATLTVMLAPQGEGKVHAYVELNQL